MRIPDRALAEIQSRLDLAEVIGEYTALARRGGRWWGCCPFHQEKTPSFSVTPEKGVFYCFGCHKGGGLFQFVMEAEKVPFRDAVELLAKKAGVELPREEEEPGGIRRETFLELNRQGDGELPLAAAREPAERGRAALPGRPTGERGDRGGVPARLGAPRPAMAVAVPDRQELHAGVPGAHGAVHASRAAGGGPAVPVRRTDHVPDRERPGRGARVRRPGAWATPSRST